jgi:Golgi apyrase
MPNYDLPHFSPRGRLLLVLFGLFVLITIFYNIKVDDSEFAVVVDAGSSGSRAHVFTYQKTSFLPDIRQIDSIKTHPGISSLKDVSEIKNYLLEILKFTTNTVPKSFQSRTPILFYATAGMRLLPENTQHQIMKAACDFFMENSEFYVPNCQHFRVISGLDEGIFGWLSVNYLKKTLSTGSSQSAQTFGFLDMVRKSQMLTNRVVPLFK